MIMLVCILAIIFMWAKMFESQSQQKEPQVIETVTEEYYNEGPNDGERETVEPLEEDFEEERIPNNVVLLDNYRKTKVA